MKDIKAMVLLWYMYYLLSQLSAVCLACLYIFFVCGVLRTTAAALVPTKLLHPSAPVLPRIKHQDCGAMYRFHRVMMEALVLGCTQQV